MYVNDELMINVTTTVLLDRRIKKKDNTYSVKLRVTFRRKQKYYPLHVSLAPEEYDKVCGPKPRNQFKTMKLEFEKAEQRARSIVNDLKSLGSFTFPAFEKALYGEEVNDDMFTGFAKKVQKLRNNDQVKTADIYEDSCISLKKYINKDTFKISDVTPDFLQGYENWMLREGNSVTTVGFYLRNLRHIFNVAIKEKIVQREAYPFGRDGYEIPASKNIKKALSIVEIGKIYHYTPKSEIEAWARDIWLFSYLGNGMNIKDIALLKYKHIKDNEIIFIREKTKRSAKKQQEPIVFKYGEDCIRIVERWGRNTEFSDSYIFEIITDDSNPQRIADDIDNAVKKINKYIKRIAKALKIKADVTTYYARHSFSTILMQNGAPVEYISKSLGHKSIQTTRNYLGSFGDEVMDKFAESLVSFKKKEDN